MSAADVGGPLVSVVVPTFNRAELMMRAIESALRQTFDDMEVVVVDDCSTDTTAELLAAVGDPRVRVLRHETNCGLADSRNTGVSRAAGRYVAFLDDDDEWLPGKIEAQLDALRAAPDPERVLIYTQAFVDDGISSDVRPGRAIRTGEPLSEYLMRGEGLVPIQSVLVPTELARSAPFAPGRRRLEDYTWYLELESRGVEFRLVERPLIVWHVDIERRRLSRDVSFEQADEWIASSGSRLTPLAQKAFLAREIAPFVHRRGNRLRIARAIVVAAVSGAISPSEAVKSAVKATFSRPTIAKLRRVFPRRRFG